VEPGDTLSILDSGRCHFHLSLSLYWWWHWSNAT